MCEEQVFFVENACTVPFQVRISKRLEFKMQRRRRFKKKRAGWGGRDVR
jgi:hypothetical protein